ncbi:hypothetical protein GCM10009844_00310 [Nocardioides koreensis]|uniref:Uncharacterized protein n=1 Tax=Nocardioides koreensis TaxID=433651 RepID=A0ABP5KNW1_9ACTN
MSDLERMRAEREARDTAATRSSADRARLWAGLNRYLSSEARHEHKVAEVERRAVAEADRRTDGEPTDKSD